MTAPALTRERLSAARVLVVGDAMLDRYWFGAVERISPEAPVPVVRVNTSKEQERPGGAANVAWNVKALSAHPRLLTAIGSQAGLALQNAKLYQLFEHVGIPIPTGMTVYDEGSYYEPSMEGNRSLPETLVRWDLTSTT